MTVISARNNALNVNPPQGAAHLTTGASDWLWAVTAIYVLSFVIFYLLSFKPPNGERIFHYLFTIGLFVGAVAYYAMASDLAFTVIETSLYHSDAATYQIFFAKYVNWVVSFPVVIIALGLISGVSWATIFFNVALAWIWIISYVCSAYTTTRYKWGFWAWGTAAYIFLAIQTLWYGFSCASRINLRSHYILLAAWANLLWVSYPIAFALSDGGNVISVPESFIFFGILDVLFLPVIGFAILLLSRKWDYGLLNLHFTQYGRVAGREGVFPEKNTTPERSAPDATPAGHEGIDSA